MRLGISSKEGCEDPVAWAKRLRKIGCGCVVFPVDYTQGEAMIEKYVKAIKEEDLVIAEVGVWKNVLALDEQEQKKAREYCRGQLRLADKIGANCCVNVAGAIGEFWAGAYKENFSKTTWKRTVASIQEVIDEVNPQNTYFTIEPMPYMIPMNPDQYLELIEDVNRDQFAVHMDIFNWITDPTKYFFHEEFMEECFDKLGPYIKSCHLKDTLLLKEPNCQIKEVKCGEGTINLEKYVQLANKYNVEMPMIIEHLKNDKEYLDNLAYVRTRFEKAGT